MANVTTPVPSYQWTQLTTGDVTSLRVTNNGGSELFISATAGATPPTDLDGAIPVPPKVTFIGTLAEYWPGVSGANRVYAWTSYPTQASVSHA